MALNPGRRKTTKMTIPDTSFDINWETSGQEVVTHLRKLLQCDTRNPPGNETRAAAYLQLVLQQEGIASEIVGPSPDRGTLIARLHGDGSAPPLLLMSHTDVVAVEPEKWTHDPFAGDIGEDGFIYGRGALDMKNMVAMELMTLLLLKRSGVPLKRDVIFMAAADEEVGGYQGAGWVVQHHPELIQAEYALNEGGGSGFEVNGQYYYSVQVAEKGTARFRIRATGTPGHGSVPRPDNAVFKLAETLVTLQRTPLPVHFTKSLRAYITGLASTQPDDFAQALLAVIADEAGADVAIEALPAKDVFKAQLHALVRNSISPTILKAGAQINVIPSEAEAQLDARTLPGWTPETFLEELHTIVGTGVDIEFIEPSVPLEADPESPLFEIIKTVLHEHAPEATAVPTLLTGATDAKHVSLLGTKVYGFAPDLYIPGTADDERRIHGHDERVRVQSLQWGTRVLYEVVSRFAG
jgi:acetylornithine deacetylase/succinyl-diaminopimelate desuccinylase-like protein